MLSAVITTLCMVETPAAALTVTPSTHEEGDKVEKEGLLETGPAITLVHQKPITSSIRGTIKHLRENAGKFARFRGLRIYFLYAFVVGLVVGPVKAILPNIPGQMMLVSGITAAALSPLHAAWTHKVISMPSEKTFWQRIPSKSSYKTLALPAAIDGAMPYLSIYLTSLVAIMLNLHNLDQEQLDKYTGGQLACLALRILGVVVFSVVCTLFLCLPATVTLIRIEASILPESEDVIVPFDRTFGGKVVSPMHGGSGKVGFLDAWRSFTWEARRRLIKLFIKTFALVFGLAMLIMHVLLAEAFIALGPQFGMFMAKVSHAENELLFD